MARKKIVLDRIANDATRRATFKKRRRGLVKKASELATLCDVEACLVVYGEGDAEPEVWPSVEGAHSVLEHFRSLPETEQCKKMMNQEDFLRQRIAKLRDQVDKARRENRERENKLLLHDALAGKLGGYQTLSVEQLTSLDCLVNDKIRAVTARLAELRAQNQVIPLPALPAPPPMPMPMSMPVPMPPTSSLMPPTSSLMTPIVPLPYMNPAELPPIGPPPGFEGMGHIQNHNQNQIQNQNHEQDSWLMNVARNGGDLGALVYSGFIGGNSNGTSTSNGASTSSGAGGGAGGPDMTDMFHPGMLGYWPWDDSAGPSFPPM